MRIKLFLLGTLALCIMAVAACAAPALDPGAQIKSLVDVLNAGNTDAAIAFFADDATQTQTPPPTGTSGVRTGKEQIRGFYNGLVTDHFSVDLSNVKVAGEKVTYTCTFSTDSYKKMGVAPLVTNEEAVFVGGKIKSQTITLTPESMAKIQAAMAAAGAPKKVLLFMKEAPNVMELMLTQEAGVMKSLLEKAGFTVVVASISGQPITGGAATLKPDLKIADVKVEDYVGFIFPCLAVDTVPAEPVEMIKKAVALGKPVAAQNGSVFLLAKAGVLNGKEFAILTGYEKMTPNGIYKGAGVVQDGNLITSGSCPFAGRSGTPPDTTVELTQKFITLLGTAK